MIINKRIYGDRIEKVPPEWIFLGAGNNGVVYGISANKVIKVFREEEVCDKEGDILLRVHGNRYFPKVIEIGKNYIVREKVEGRCLKNMIKEEGLQEDIAGKLVELLHEFRKLGFTRIDMRLRDIYVDEERNLKLIDPKGYYTRHVSYPRHLCKGLVRYGVLNTFLQVLFDRDPKLYEKTMEHIFRPDEDDGDEGIRPNFLKILKKQKGKVDSYNLFGKDFSTLDLVPLAENEFSDGELNFIDIDTIEDLL